MNRKDYSLDVSQDILLSSRDIAKLHGKSRQWWEKLMSQGKIYYHQTSAAKITSTKWVDLYLTNKKDL